MAEWFTRAYRAFTPAQELCIPAILEGRSVLLSSPTGSGKTLAGFLGIIDWLVRATPRPGHIYAIYISPLRSLTYDIQKNLTRPLREMGLDEQIRVGSRTGDTPAKERAAIRRRPPHILLTTPESLAILLCQPAYHDALRTCRFVVIDELHALAENKRGTHLSLSLERLERLRQPRRLPTNPELKSISAENSSVRKTEIQDEKPLQNAENPQKRFTESVEENDHLPIDSLLCRIGLSATISPMETMASFLVGTGRPCIWPRHVWNVTRGSKSFPPSGVTPIRPPDKAPGASCANSPRWLRRAAPCWSSPTPVPGRKSSA